MLHASTYLCCRACVFATSAFVACTHKHPTECQARVVCALCHSGGQCASTSMCTRRHRSNLWHVAGLQPRYTRTCWCASVRRLLASRWSLMSRCSALFSACIEAMTDAASFAAFSDKSATHRNQATDNGVPSLTGLHPMHGAHLLGRLSAHQQRCRLRIPAMLATDPSDASCSTHLHFLQPLHSGLSVQRHRSGVRIQAGRLRLQCRRRPRRALLLPQLLPRLMPNWEQTPKLF